MKSSALFGLLLGLLLIGGVVVNAWQYLGEAASPAKGVERLSKGSWYLATARRMTRNSIKRR